LQQIIALKLSNMPTVLHFVLKYFFFTFTTHPAYSDTRL